MLREWVNREDREEQIEAAVPFSIALEMQSGPEATSVRVLAIPLMTSIEVHDRESMHSPSAGVVGEVAELEDALQWFVKQKQDAK